MGFVKETYSNGNAGLVVSFSQNTTTKNFFAGDSVEEAMKHFNLYLDENNRLRVDSESEQAIKTLDIEADQATEFRAAINDMLVSLTDEAADKNKILFPLWSGDGIAYAVGDRIRYNNVLYKVLQAHTSQSDWTPAAAASLFATVIDVVVDEDGEVDENAIAEWVQPDSTNPYMTGDRVMFEGSVYESTIDNNVWSPATYPAGWILIEE